jgi:hypothetical protein
MIDLNSLKFHPITQTHRAGGLALLLKKFPQVKMIADALEPVQFTVTARDRRNAKAWDGFDCAAARGCVRDFKADGALILLSNSYLVFGEKAIRFMTPPTVAREVVTFDRHEDFATGTYRLSAVTPSSRFGEHGRKHHKSRKTGTKKQRALVVARHHTTRVRGIDA